MTSNDQTRKDMTMTPEYRAQELKVARENLAAARKLMEAAPVGKKRNLVAQDVEFWGNKVAFLDNAKVE